MAVPTIATLAERVDNHIKFFWIVVGAGFLWLGTLSLLLYHINDTANRIVSDQTGIKDSFIDQSLAIYAALPPDQFKTTLPDVASTVAKAQKQRLTASPKVVNELQSKLINTESSVPDYWPTAAALITYHSFLVVGNIQNWGKVFKPCIGPADMDSSPEASAQVLGPDGKPIGPKTPIRRIGERDCYLVLDGKRASGFDCTRCLVKYSGGPLSMRDVKFIDCLFIFDFPSQQPPPIDGQLLSRVLLTSEFKYVAIPA